MRTAFPPCSRAALLVPAAARAAGLVALGPRPDTWVELHLGAGPPAGPRPRHRGSRGRLRRAFGARFSPYLGVDGGVGWVRASGSEGRRSHRLRLPLTANLRLRAPYGRGAVPRGGAGLHIATFSSERTWSACPPRRLAHGGRLGYHVGLGEWLPAVADDALRRRRQPDLRRAQVHGTAVRLDGLRAALTLTYHL